MTKFEKLLLLILVNYFRFKVGESKISNDLRKDCDNFTAKIIVEILE